MNPIALIDKYYPENNELKHILLLHSQLVAQKCRRIATSHPELQPDLDFLEEAALLHDIGIFMTDAPGIHCHGTHPYICHGTLGAELLRKEGFPRHARVCERHTGTGLTASDIESQHLPLTPRDLRPETLEEEIVCYADKFFSKTRPEEEKTYEQAFRSVSKHSTRSADIFKEWHQRFG